MVSACRLRGLVFGNGLPVEQVLLGLLLARVPGSLLAARRGGDQGGHATQPADHAQGRVGQGRAALVDPALLVGAPADRAQAQVVGQQVAGGQQRRIEAVGQVGVGAAGMAIWGRVSADRKIG